MRRHAKASTAGSTQRQASRLGRGLFGFGCLAIFALAALLAGGASSAVAAEECPNEIRRQEQGVFALRLPDCRAYENVSPGSQPDANGEGVASAARASVSGNAITYKSIYPASGEQSSGQFYLSTRGASGWTPKSVVPTGTPTLSNKFACASWVFFSSDLAQNILEEDSHAYNDPEAICERNEEVLDPRETHGYRNLFLHDNAGDSYELVNLDPAEGEPGNSVFRAGSDDLSTVAFESEAQLTPDAPGVTPGIAGGYNTFVWSHGAVHLATILPDGTPVQSKLAVSQFESPFDHDKYYDYYHAVSNDGSKLFFTYGGAVYMRVNPAQPQSAISGGECTEPTMACTYQVDESQGPGASGSGTFEVATADGKTVFFTDDSRLTPDSTAVAGKEDLYEYDTETRDLTDLTVNASEPADVWAVSDISEDGSYVYFVAEAALDGSGAPSAGDCEHYEEDNFCNLYVRHNGVTTYITSLSVDDTTDFKGEQGNYIAGNYDGHAVEHHPVPNEFSGYYLTPSVEASPNGRYFAFETVEERSTEFPGAGITFGTFGVSIYDAATGQLNHLLSHPNRGSRFVEPAQAYWAGLDERNAYWRVNQVLNDGSYFFETATPLVPQDTNEEVDVYRYKDGEYTLFSTGTSQGRSEFLDASADGKDVFIATAVDILPNDTEGGLTVYDARVGGGFPEPPPLPGCEGEACRDTGTGASNAGATGSASFQGAGNQAQHHKRDCGIAAKRAQTLSRAAKRLRRLASRSNDPKQAKQLRQRSAKLAKQGRGLSKSAKRCRRANRGAGK